MASKRLPLSCENCRQRKIRCISSKYQAPCETCARRGYASSCRFRRDTHELPTHSPPQPEGLIGNVSALEDLLRQNIAVTSALLNRRNETRPPSPDPSPAVSSAASNETPSGHQSGRLMVLPSNHVRFVPSSDLGDSDLIDAMHDSTPGCPSGFPFFDQPGAGAVSDELLDILPPLPQLEELKIAFFKVFSPLFHILHDPTFHARYEEFKHNPKSVSLPFLGLLFVILGVSVTSLDDTHPILMHLGRDPSPGVNIRSLAAKYRGAAMRCLVADNFMFRHNLCTVQCLVLLIYAINHSQGPAWSLLGTTLHIAVAIGCAVDPARLNVDLIEAEERRRCWAALRMLYTIQNTCLGNLMPFRIDSQVDLPADVEDDDLSRRSPPNDPAAPPTKMTYVLYKFRLYNLAFDICQLTSPSDRAKVEALDTKVACEQQCHFLRFSGRSLSHLEPCHQAHYYIISNYTSHLVLLLHRPWLSSTGGNPVHIYQSIDRCEAAATAILYNFEKLHSDPTFKSYRWYYDGLGSFYAFFSITTLLILHGSGHLNAQSKLETINLVLRCVDVLITNAPRSAVASKAALILEPFMQQLVSVAVDPGPQLISPVTEGEATWNVYPELGNMFFDVPAEQCLGPSGFPWVIT
ncbi:fungal-specific transcription factor domain-containing protein [Aspergillus californicus]